MSFNPELEETIYVDFITSSPTTGAAADADSTPTCEIFEDTSDTAILTPTVVKRTSKTGNYRVPVVCTAANGFEAGKSYAVIVSATVGAVAAKARVSNFQVRTYGPDDVKTDTAAIKTKTDQLVFTTANRVDARVMSMANDTITSFSIAIDPDTTALFRHAWLRGVADSGTTTTMIDASLTEADVDYWKGNYILFTTGTIAGQCRLITGFNPATDTVTFTPAVTQAVGTNGYEIHFGADSLASTAIKAKTDQLTFTAANQVDSNALTVAAAQMTLIADALMKRDMSAVTGESARSLLNALRFLRNRWNTTATPGTLSVYKEDDTTVSWTRPLTTDPAAEPITGAN